MPESLSRGEQTRNAILQAAHDLFVQQGYHGTSMRQIAQQAGLALGGLYNHFPSKEAVFEAVFFTYHPYHEVLPLIAESQGNSLDEVVRDAARRMLAVMERWIAAAPEQWLMYHRVWLGEDEGRGTEDG